MQRRPRRRGGRQSGWGERGLWIAHLARPFSTSEDGLVSVLVVISRLLPELSRRKTEATSEMVQDFLKRHGDAHFLSHWTIGE